MTNHSGADWIKAQLPYINKDRKGIPANQNAEMSPLGEAVANLLGELFYGIYHLDHKALYKVDWRNNVFIEFSLGWKQLATTDFDELSRLVFLAHHMAIRVSIEASARKHLKLLFHQRYRGEGLGISKAHPTLDQAVAAFKAEMEKNEVPEFMMGRSPVDGAVRLLLSSAWHTLEGNPEEVDRIGKLLHSGPDVHRHIDDGPGVEVGRDST
jgi:hypothetical protein